VKREGEGGKRKGGGRETKGGGKEMGEEKKKRPVHIRIISILNMNEDPNIIFMNPNHISDGLGLAWAILRKNWDLRGFIPELTKAVLLPKICSLR
jgi:hypothetical protein